MSEEAAEALANLELGRELYTDSQRTQFYTEFELALENVGLAERNSSIHWETNPIGWKFWQTPPVAWTEESHSLLKLYRDAVRSKENLEKAHPLLVKIYWFKYQPVD